MKKAMLLSVLVLSVSALYAQETQVNSIADGRTRNEEAYEQMLQQTGWKGQNTKPVEKDVSPSPQTSAGLSQPKSN